MSLRGVNLSPGSFGEIVADPLFWVGITLMLVFFIAVYVYFSMAWMTIARKLKHSRPWLAWIPFANIAMILQLGGFHWAWVFLAATPFIGGLILLLLGMLNPFAFILALIFFIVASFVGGIALLVLGIVATWRAFERRKHPGWFSLSILIPYVGVILYFIAIGIVAWKDK
jgi:hypothetical protein